MQKKKQSLLCFNSYCHGLTLAQPEFLWRKLYLLALASILTLSICGISYELAYTHLSKREFGLPFIIHAQKYFFAVYYYSGWKTGRQSIAAALL